uniref:Uncharacterized protein n=1 Tax=Globodera pallida TaxID=36090 RepID=A0A183BR29_GLOPA
MFSSSTLPVLLQLVAVIFISNPSEAYSAGRLYLRDSYPDSARFFIPNALLADQLLASGPVSSLRPALFDRSPIPAKRYFDSLAGQSLGKRTAPPATEEEMPRGDDARVNSQRAMRLDALRPGWPMW